MKDKLVSVVVQAYNSADTICDTLDSIKKQSYANIEIIISDDKSTDNTLDIVQKWIKENESTNIKVITTERNTGIPGNNNRALKEVNGEYVEFLAADDLLMPTAIEKMLLYCEKYKNVVPITRVRLFSDKNMKMENVQKYCMNCYEFAQMDHRRQYRQLLKQNQIVAPAASFYPTRLLRKIGGFDESFKCFEDYPINLKILKYDYCFGFLDEELIQYRISPKSLTGSDLTPIKKDEIKLFWKVRFINMFRVGMGWEAIKQAKSWVILARKIKRGKIC